MNIIAEAKAGENRIQSNTDLLSAQREMLETMLIHHAISETEHHKSQEISLSESFYFFKKYYGIKTCSRVIIVLITLFRSYRKEYMILWSIKTMYILKLIQETGTYICDPNQILGTEKGLHPTHIPL